MKINLTILVILLLLIDVFMIYKVYSTTTDKNNIAFVSNTRAKALADAKGQNYKLVQDLLAAQKIEASELPDSIAKVLSKKYPVIVLRIHLNNCNDCVKESLKLMDKLSETTTLHSMVLANFPNKEALFAAFPIKVPYILTEKIDQDSASSTKPYLFTVSSGKIISNVYLPEWDMLDLLDGYYNELKRMYKLN